MPLRVEGAVRTRSSIHQEVAGRRGRSIEAVRTALARPLIGKSFSSSWVRVRSLRQMQTGINGSSAVARRHAKMP